MCFLFICSDRSNNSECIPTSNVTPTNFKITILVLVFYNCKVNDHCTFPDFESAKKSSESLPVNSFTPCSRISGASFLMLRIVFGWP